MHSSMLLASSNGEQHSLGSTLESNVREKAGIIKPWVPCVGAFQFLETMKVIEEVARKMKAPLLRLGQEWGLEDDGKGMIFEDDHWRVSLPKPALAGMYQIENAGAAVAALRALGEGLPEEEVRTRAWPARMQRQRRGPLASLAPDAEIWLDGGQNANAAQAADMSMRMPVRSRAMVVAMKESKDVEEFWEPFGGLAAFAWTVPLEENGVAPEELARVANLAGIQCKPAKSVEDAVREVGRAMPDARVLICGSLYSAGEVLRAGNG